MVMKIAHVITLHLCPSSLFHYLDCRKEEQDRVPRQMFVKAWTRYNEMLHLNDPYRHTSGIYSKLLQFIKSQNTITMSLV